MTATNQTIHEKLVSIIRNSAFAGRISLGIDLGNDHPGAVCMTTFGGLPSTDQLRLRTINLSNSTISAKSAVVLGIKVFDQGTPQRKYLEEVLLPPDVNGYRSFARVHLDDRGNSKPVNFCSLLSANVLSYRIFDDAVREWKDRNNQFEFADKRGRNNYVTFYRYYSNFKNIAFINPDVSQYVRFCALDLIVSRTPEQEEEYQRLTESIFIKSCMVGKEQYGLKLAFDTNGNKSFVHHILLGDQSVHVLVPIAFLVQAMVYKILQEFFKQSNTKISSLDWSKFFVALSQPSSGEHDVGYSLMLNDAVKIAVEAIKDDPAKAGIPDENIMNLDESLGAVLAPAADQVCSNNKILNMAVDLNAPASASTARKILSIDIGCGTFLLNFLKCMCDNLELISFVSKVIGGRDFTIATYQCIMDLLRAEFEQAYRKNHPRAAQVDWNAFDSWINRMNEKESIMEAAENLKIRFCSSYARDNVNFVEFRSRLPRNDYDIDSITITKEMLETRWKPLVEQIRRDCIAFVKQLIKDGHISGNGGDFTLQITGLPFHMNYLQDAIVDLFKTNKWAAEADMHVLPGESTVAIGNTLYPVCRWANGLSAETSRQTAGTRNMTILLERTDSDLQLVAEEEIASRWVLQYTNLVPHNQRADPVVAADPSKWTHRIKEYYERVDLDYQSLIFKAVEHYPVTGARCVLGTFDVPLFKTRQQLQQMGFEGMELEAIFKEQNKVYLSGKTGEHKYEQMTCFENILGKQISKAKLHQSQPDTNLNELAQKIRVDERLLNPLNHDHHQRFNDAVGAFKTSAIVNGEVEWFDVATVRTRLYRATQLANQQRATQQDTSVEQVGKKRQRKEPVKKTASAKKSSAKRARK